MGKKRCKLCPSVGVKGFFTFPTAKRKHICEEWLKICDLPADTDTRNMFVCFRHFDSSEIEPSIGYFRAKPGN